MRYADLSALTIAMCIQVSVYVIVRIVTAKFARNKLITKLSLLPLYAILVFLLLLMIQVWFNWQFQILYTNPDLSQWIMVVKVIQQFKCVAICFIIMLPNLEQSCLRHLLLIQAKEKNKKR